MKRRPFKLLRKPRHPSQSVHFGLIVALIICAAASRVFDSGSPVGEFEIPMILLPNYADNSASLNELTPEHIAQMDYDSAVAAMRISQSKRNALKRDGNLTELEQWTAVQQQVFKRLRDLKSKE